MTEAAAKPVPSSDRRTGGAAAVAPGPVPAAAGADRRPSASSRCGVAARSRPREYRGDANSSSPRAASSAPVTLPYFSASRYADGRSAASISGQFAWPDGEAATRLVGVPAALHQRRRGRRQRRRDPGQPARSRRQPARPQHRRDRGDPGVAAARRRQRSSPIRLFIWGPITGFLDRIYVGPDDVLRPSYDLRTLLFVTLPVVFSSWQAILAVILGIMWVMRRHEPAYGVLAAAMAVGVGAGVPADADGRDAVLAAQRDPDLFRAAGKRRWC